MRKKKHQTTKLNLEALESRIVPSTYEWSPAFKDPTTLLFTWDASGRDPVTHQPGCFNYQKDGGGRATTLPGAGDVIIVDHNKFENIDSDVDMHGSPGNLQGLQVGGFKAGSGLANWGSTLWLSNGLTVGGGVAQNDKFSLLSGTMDLNNNDFKIQSCMTTSVISGGTVANSGTTGDFFVTSVGTNTNLLIEDVTGAPTIRVNLRETGSTTNQSSIGIGQFTTSNLTMGTGKGIFVNIDSMLQLQQTNPTGNDALGGIVRATDKTTTLITVNGGTINRGNGSLNNWNSQVVGGPIDLKSGLVEIFPGAEIHVTGMDANNVSYLQEGGTTSIDSNTSGAGKLSGQLNCDATGAKISMTGGLMNLMVNSSTEFTEVISNAGFTIGSGATLAILKGAADPTTNISVRVLGNVAFAAGSTFQDDAWLNSGSPDACILDVAAGDLAQAGTIKFMFRDGTTKPAKLPITVFKCPLGTITGGFTTLTDNINPPDTYTESLSLKSFTVN